MSTSLTKIEKIDLVRKLNLNTETNIVVKSVEPGEIDKLESFLKLHKLNRVSIRTQAVDNSRRTPHYPIVALRDVFRVVRDLSDKGYYSIVATPIDPKDAVLAGAVLKEGMIYTVELAIGQHTVRRVTHDGIIDIKVVYDSRTREIKVSKSYDDYYGIMVVSIINECKKVPFNECVIELSYYRVPVGYRSRHVIIWDIDSSGTDKSTKEIEGFYYNTSYV